MKVYYLEIEDYHGVFSSEEKAIEYFNTVAKDQGWTNISISREKDWVVINYNYDDNDSDYAMITEFTVDDPND